MHYFSFLLSQTKGNSFNCFPTVQTTIKKHSYQHQEHRREKKFLPDLNSNFTLSLGGKKDTYQQYNSSFHRPPKNLASASLLPPASCPGMYLGKAQLIISFLVNKVSFPVPDLLPLFQDNSNNSIMMKTPVNMFNTAEGLWLTSVLLTIILFSSCSIHKLALNSIPWVKSALPMFVCHIDQNWHQITSTPEGREALFVSHSFFWIMILHDTFNVLLLLL